MGRPVASTDGDMTNDILILDQVFKSYGKVSALSGLNLRVKEGDILGFVGPNGAGKSSLMRTIATLQDADTGEISFDGII